MIFSLIQNFFKGLALASILTIPYFNIFVVPDSQIGILKEKIQGFEKKPLLPGYHWVWTGFVPEKWDFFLIDTFPKVIQVDFKKGLTYTDYLDLSDIYRFQINLKIRYKVQKEGIYHLLEILENDISKLSNFITKRIQILLEFKYFEFYKSDSDIPLLKAKFQNYFSLGRKKGLFYEDFQKIFKKEKLKLEYWEILKLYVPDKSMYQAQIQSLDLIFQAQRSALVSKIHTESKIFEKRLFNNVEIEKARKMSDVLSQNSQVLEYLSIEKLNPYAKIIISNKSNDRNEYERYSLEEKSKNLGEHGKLPPLSR